MAIMGLLPVYDWSYLICHIFLDKYIIMITIYENIYSWYHYKYQL